jgi:thiol-disulfide isomerase/thioredoxin
VWVLVSAVVVAAALGTLRTLSNGVFRGARRVRGSADGPASTHGPGSTDGGRASVLAGTAYDGQRGDRATLLQFSSAFCAPCRATRRTLTEVARVVPGVTHVEVDAEHHLSLVRELGVLRTPTTLVLDADGRELTRATGAPRSDQVLAALGARLP